MNGQRAEATPAAGGGALEGKVAAVVGASRDERALDLPAGELDEAGANALAVPTDVREPAAVAALIERTAACFGRLDIACNRRRRRAPAHTPG